MKNLISASVFWVPTCAKLCASSKPQKSVPPEVEKSSASYCQYLAATYYNTADMILYWFCVNAWMCYCVCATHSFEDISNWYMDFLYNFYDFLYSLIDFKWTFNNALIFYAFSLILYTNLKRSSKTPIQPSKLKPIFPAKVHLRSVCAAHIFEDISNWYMDFLYNFNGFLYGLIDFK